MECCSNLHSLYIKSLDRTRRSGWHLQLIERLDIAMTQETTIVGAAQQLGVSPDTIRRRIRQGQLPASKQATSRGLVWLVDVTDEALGPRAEADGEVERLREELGHWRELALSLPEELVARSREVQQLLALLERAHERLFPRSDAGLGQTVGVDGRQARERLPDRAP